VAAYFLTEITVHHPKKMGEYASKVGATIAKREGVLLHGASEKREVVEGTLGEHPIKVLIQFPSMEKAKGCYNSPEYKEILNNRLEKTLQYL
jgi:uncharacterized protein (DUF1330 family)|tara:strand:+ start:1163 stop:1438 length:276 start_codon:yes stop_codon:yes gene_type:complete